MRKQRNALIGALAWWVARRWLSRRAALAVAARPGGAGGGRRGAARTIGGAVALVGVLAAGFVLWRKLLGNPKGVEGPAPPAPEPLRPASAPVKPSTEQPPTPSAA